MNTDKFQERLIDDVLIGGNHLAVVLLNEEGADPTEYGTYEQALDNQGQSYADIWAAWRAIMNLAEYRRSK